MSRRRALLASGGGLSGAALLVACGSSGDSGGGSGDTSALLARPTDTTKQAKRGGILKRSAGADPATLDANALSATIAAYLEFVYARLFAFKPGYQEPSQDEIQADHAESWELSPDRLQITAKLRQGLRFHNLPPVNGRTIDTEDVVFSWKRFSTVGGNRASLVNSVNPNAPVLSVTATDARTIVIKLKEPLVYAQAVFAHREGLNILPKEADDQGAIDLRRVMLGSGPYQLAAADYQPSIGLTFKRHVDYWDKTGSFIDQIDYPIVSEYATNVAQFRAGAIHTFAVNQEEVLPLKRDVADLNLYQSGLGIDSGRMFFGWQQPEVRDERVRQAMSLAIDRDGWIEAKYNGSRFESEGLDVERRYNTALQATETTTGWWLDPHDKNFGPNSKYFSRNVAEAKKLLAAAGFPNGVEIQSNHITTSQLGITFPKDIEIWEGMMAEAGFRFKKNIIDYSGEYLKIRDTNGDFAGIGYKTGPPAPTNDPINRLQYEFSTKGGPGFHGFDAAGKGDKSGDPTVESLIAKGVAEFDTEKRRAIVFDLQRHLASKWYAFRWPGGSSQFAVVWPVIRNFRVWQEGTASASLVAHKTWWLDETQAPIKKA